MRTKQINISIQRGVGYRNIRGDKERIEYECPCKKGKIIEEHDSIPGFQDHDVWIECHDCYKNYTLDLSKGIRNWEHNKKSEI